MSKFCIRKQLIFYFLSLFFGFFLSGKSFSLTANKVWFEFHPGFYRVIVQYTIPALKEFREVTVEFTSKKKAEAFYWRVVRGGEFYLGDPESVRIVLPAGKPDPW